MELCCVSVSLLFVIVGLIFIFLHRRYTYWSRHNVPHDKPVWFMGNLQTVGHTTSLREPFRDFYEKYKHQTPLAGFYLSLRTAIVLLDLNLIKQVLIKDFKNFAHRGNYYNEADDPISAHLFNLDGARWHEMRAKLTPTFTALKMNQMLPTVVMIAERFVQVMQQQVNVSKSSGELDTIGIEVKELLARFTTDVIGSCAFGLDCNSLNDANAEFRVMGRSVFTKRRHGRIIFAFLQAFPNLSKRLHLKLVRNEVSAFYMRVVRETLQYRDQNNIKRNDFMNLLMELRTNKKFGGITVEQIAAQAFVFLLAGFETSSNTMGFALYELALHPEIQNKARAEVIQVCAKHDGNLNYEAVKQLKYIQQIFYETMRHYSIATILMRQAINDYSVPDTKYTITAGTPIIIPIDAIHHDADIYSQPEKFDPTRFTPEAIEARHAMSWLPFGAGPRNCIGARFGEMQSIVGLAMLLKHFKFLPCKETPIPLVIDKKSFVLASKDGIVLNVQTIV